MASPQQRPDPNWERRAEPNRRGADLREVDRRELRSRGSGAAWFAWWWIWLAVILCAVWFAGWGWGGYGGWWWGNRGAAYSAYPAGTAAGAAGSAAGTGMAAASGATANMNMVTGPSVAVLSAIDKRGYIGKPFQVNDAVVTKVVNDRVLWIGQSNYRGNGASMLVVLQGAANAHVSEGDLVNVTGTVHQAPAGAQARNTWKLTSNGQKRLEQEGAYVAARQVQSLSNGNHG